MLAAQGLVGVGAVPGQPGVQEAGVEGVARPRGVDGLDIVGLDQEEAPVLAQRRATLRAQLGHRPRAAAGELAQRLGDGVGARDGADLHLVGEEQVDLGQRVEEVILPALRGIVARVEGGGEAGRPRAGEERPAAGPQPFLQEVGRDVEVAVAAQRGVGDVGRPQRAHCADEGHQGPVARGGEGHRQARLERGIAHDAGHVDARLGQGGDAEIAPRVGADLAQERHRIAQPGEARGADGGGAAEGHHAVVDDHLLADRGKGVVPLEDQVGVQLSHHEDRRHVRSSGGSRSSPPRG